LAVAGEPTQGSKQHAVQGRDRTAELAMNPPESSNGIEKNASNDEEEATQQAEPPRTFETRHLYTLGNQLNSGFIGNEIYQAKYNIGTFLPLFLIEQLSRFANVYFVCVSVLQTLPQITITNGLPTSLMPLSIVLMFDGIIQAIEDYRRHLDDDRTNKQTTLAVRPSSDEPDRWQFQDIEWQHVRVGDVLKIRRGETVAADCVFLRSQSSDGETPDRCYVMTAQLDGETNLKLRRAPHAATEAMQGGDDAIASTRVAIECE